MKHVFISYKREEREYVAALASALEANGYKVWWDHEIPGGEAWESKIKEALDQAFVVLIIVTPEGENSGWMQNEQIYAVEKALPLIPLLRRGDLWLRLKRLQYVDGRENTVDHPMPDGLLAALLECELHDLPENLRKKVINQDQSRQQLIVELTELAKERSPQGLAARCVLERWKSKPLKREVYGGAARRSWLRLLLISSAIMLSIVVISSLIVMFIVSRPSASNGIELLGSIHDWAFWREDPPQSTIDVKENSNIIEVSFNVVKWGWTVISRQLPAKTLVGTTGIRFTYQGTGNPNTIEVHLIYPQGTVYSIMLHRETTTVGWTTIEIPYSQFACWPDTGKGEDKCSNNLPLLNLEKVTTIEFAFSNKLHDPNNPNDLNPDDIPGAGTVRLKSIQAIRP